MVRVIQGDLAGAGAPFHEVVAEATADHDAMFRVYGLLMEGYVQAYQGDGGGARAAAGTALEACAELVESYEGACYAGVAVACLADNDAMAAKRASEIAFQRLGLEPAMSGIYVWLALAPLGVRPTPRAYGWVRLASRYSTPAMKSR
jgi:hypothetical protein